MFTGIIEETGRIKKILSGSAGAVVEITCEKITSDIKTGDSIAVNGVCLTATSFTQKSFTADASEETLKRTSLKQLAPGKPVNLERAMRADSRFGGHIVQGHVDGVGRITNCLRNGDFWDMTVEIPENLRKFVPEKGSLAVDGISLTVAADLTSRVKIAVIPHTFEYTNLATLSSGDIVNIEVDLVARYLDKLLKYERKESNLYNLLPDLG
ncbi:MAG: riboflavin synthase [Deferribacteraceae bacterium]|jgi:riboflavin synthase|nr:riboflavin synthase [Deferribacteraceae bacterium]